jgi:hypothetical protein
MGHIFLNVVSIFNFIFQFQQRYIAKTSVADPGSGAFLTPGSGMGRKSASGSGIRHEQTGSYFLELRNHFLVFLGLIYLNSLMRIRDPGWKKSDPAKTIGAACNYRILQSNLHAGFKFCTCKEFKPLKYGNHLGIIFETFVG